MQEPMKAFSYGETAGSLWVRADPVRREPGSWREELKAAAMEIANRADRPLWLGMSGGVDAEIMARAFFEQGINFSAVTLEHVHGTNRADVERAKTWCFSHGIPHKIIPFDLREFMTSGTDAYIRAGHPATKMYRYMQLRIMEIIDELGGYAVLGNGKLFFYEREDGSEPFITSDRSFVHFFDWMKERRQEHQPFFLMATPELLLSYLRMPIIESALKMHGAFLNAANNVALRRFAYQAVFPEIKSRNPSLSIDAEPELLKHAERRLRSAFALSNTSVDIPASQLVAQLTG